MSSLWLDVQYDRSDELVRVYTEFTRPRVERHWLNGPEYADMRDACRSCASIGAWYRGFATLAGGDRPVLVDAAYATSSLLPTLGVKPMLGRWFDASEDPQGEALAAFTSRTVIVLSHDGGHSYNVIARLRPGVSIDAFRDELIALEVRWGVLDGPEYHAITPVQLPGVPAHPMVAYPLHADVVGSLATTLWLLQGAALFQPTVALRIE